MGGIVEAKKIITDRKKTNTRSIHVFEKVGFKKTVIVQATDGTKMVTAQLMEMDKGNNVPLSS